jgi:nucleoid-associated protein YgaU
MRMGAGPAGAHFAVPVSGKGKPEEREDGMSALEKFGILVILVLVVIIGVVAIWGVGGSGVEDGALGEGAEGDYVAVAPEPGGDKLPPWPDNGSATATLDPVSAPVVGAPVGMTPVAPPTVNAQPLPPVPAPTVSTVPPAASGTRSYTVVSGDTLTRIAKEQLGDGNLWRSIQDMNPGLDPRRMRTGQKILLPESNRGGTVASAPANPAPAPPVSAPTVRGWQPNPADGPTLSGGTAAGTAAGTTAPASTVRSEEYEVLKGETLSSISSKRLGKASDWYRILELNPGLDPKRLRAGQRIQVPVAE